VKELQVSTGSIENIVHEHVKGVVSLGTSNLNVHDQHQHMAWCQDLLDLYTSD